MTLNSKRHLPGCGTAPSVVDVVAMFALVGFLVSMFGWSANFQEPASGDEMLSGGDYLQFFVAAQLIRHGQNDRLYDFEHVQAFQHDPAIIPYEWDPDVFGLYAYPPFFVWFCLPFSFLSFHAGAMAWVVVMAGFLVAAAVLLVRTVPGGRGWFGWALLGCLLYRPVVMSLYTCQNATLSLFVIILGYVLLRRGRPFAAGVAFALLAFKPQLTLVIGLAMLGTRQWRFLAGAVAGGLVLLAASLAISPSATVDYIRLAPGMSKWIDMPGMPLERMSCWYGFWRLAFAGQPLHYAQAATVVTSVVTLVPLVFIMRRRPSPDSAAWFAALVLGTVVLSPHLLSYDLTLLLLPLYLLVTQASQDRPEHSLRRLRPWVVLLFVGACLSEPIAAATGVQVIVPLIVITLVVLARAVEQQGQPVATAQSAGGIVGC